MIITRKKVRTLRRMYFVGIIVFMLISIIVIRVHDLPRQGGPAIANHYDIFNEGQWKNLPTLELAVRMNSNPAAVSVYMNWFVRSLKLFWPEEWLNLTVILDEENPLDHSVGRNLSQLWPSPTIVYLGPGNVSVYQNQPRRRLFLDYFYPERYVSADYVGFADSDAMFTTVITPQVLFRFADGKWKPTVQARIGAPFWQQGWGCWSDVSELMLGKKEALQCMSYFPVIIKVEHIIEMRSYIERRTGKPFTEVFREAILIENPHFSNNKTQYNYLNDCVCQFSIFCNYIWYFHRNNYDFHLEMTPDENWEGQRRRASQVTPKYLRNIDSELKVPKPRVAIHARHFLEDNEFFSDALDTMKEPVHTYLERRLQEGLCFSIGFQRCPERCTAFQKSELHKSLFSFEMFEWLWDKRCHQAQRKHYMNVQRLINSNEENGKRMFGVSLPNNVCSLMHSTES
eukprot:Seg746.5 transcript_id=Seg746.5/GoldUCD/mRNA.D3Y31 product="hypothetical protein" protein_id=Seg746.5/GoldUCD/D3Y31